MTLDQARVKVKRSWLIPPDNGLAIDTLLSANLYAFIYRDGVLLQLDADAEAYCFF